LRRQDEKKNEKYLALNFSGSLTYNYGEVVLLTEVVDDFTDFSDV